METTLGNGARNRWLALIILCLGTLMIVLDSTIVNVALPSIRANLGFTEVSLAWVVNAYIPDLRRLSLCSAVASVISTDSGASSSSALQSFTARLAHLCRLATSRLVSDHHARDPRSRRRCR